MSYYVYIAKHRRRFETERTDKQVVFKVGYTSSKENRQRAARTWSPYGIQFKHFEFVSEHSARAFEKIAHAEFLEYGIVDEEGGTEWFIAPKKIFRQVIEMLEQGGRPDYTVWQMLRKIFVKRIRNSWIYKIMN